MFYTNLFKLKIIDNIEKHLDESKFYKDLMFTSLSGNKQADIIGAFNTTSRYLDDILDINNI